MKIIQLRSDTELNSMCWISFLVILSTLPLTSHSASLGASEAHSRRHGKSKSSSRRSNSYTKLPLKPSLVMIPLDIQETVNKDLDPDLDNLDTIELLGIMGTDYNREFMSIRQPAEMRTNPNGTLLYKFSNKQVPLGPMPEEIEALSDKAVKLSDDGPELRIKFSRKTKRKLQKFLWSYSYCPVRYRWKELSIRFWPRWIKTGQCESKRSCSIPAGMTCQPSKMQNIKLLRYYCPFAGNCHWIKIEYPILAECSCGCQQYTDSDYWR